MLKTVRAILATLSIIAATLLFIDFTGTAARLWPWLAQAQFIPALLSANLLALLIIFAITLLFGRVYCSIICPLGIFQDVVNWVRGHAGAKKKRKNRFGWSPAWTRTRLVVLTVFAALLILGLSNLLAASIAGLIEPYSAYGRISSQIFAPGWDWINNLLAAWSESKEENYMFYRVAAIVSIPVLAVAIATLVAIVAFAWRGGRDYCNTICPVGTILGYLSKLSLFKMRIDTSKCIDCGKCARNCKARCINQREHAIDYTRCVACMDCIGYCSTGAISYTLRKRAETTDHKAETAVDGTRRGFMLAAGALAGTAAMQMAAKGTGDGGFTPLKRKEPAKRATRIVPAGAKSIRHLSQRCTACQLCIQSCPSRVLKPAMTLDGFMQPTLDFTDGYCDTDCTKCSDICPAGAILPIDKAQKSSIKVATAVVDLDACISASEGKRCGACATYCPAGAIEMIETSEGSGVRMPMVKIEMCIGCGACEYHCPAGTVASMASSGSAIHIEGLDTHRVI